MQEQLQQLLDSEQVSPQVAAKLENLSPGTCCSHRSWGTGKITEWNTLTEQVIIDFPGKPGHGMAFDYAATSLKPLADEHIQAMIINDLEGVKTLSSDNVTECMAIIIKSLGKFANADSIQEVMVPMVVEEASWKKWWDAAKRAMKKDSRFEVPSRRTLAVVFNDEPVDMKAKYMSEFENAVGGKRVMAAVVGMTKNWKEIDDSTIIDSIITKCSQTIKKAPSSQSDQAVQLALALDEFLEVVESAESMDNGLIKPFMPDSVELLSELTERLPSSMQPKFLRKVREISGENWPVIFWGLLPFSNGKMAEEITESFREEGRFDEVLSTMEKLIRERKVTPDLLVWLCKHRKGEFKPVFHAQFIYAILSVLEFGQTGSSRGCTKLSDLVLSERTLLKDILEGATEQEIRDVTRAIILSPAFEELDKNVLKATLVKLYPFVQEMIKVEGKSRSSSSSAGDVVSWKSLQRYKDELEAIKTKKIPQTSKDIAIARSYGDLSENHEFKAAKEMMAFLQRRQAELEGMIASAQATDFKGVGTENCAIGTIVYLKDLGSNKDEKYTILGAWDSDPDHGIISYKTAVSQALLGAKVGEEVEVLTETGASRKLKVEKIEAYNP